MERLTERRAKARRCLFAFHVAHVKCKLFKIPLLALVYLFPHLLKHNTHNTHSHLCTYSHPARCMANVHTHYRRKREIPNWASAIWSCANNLTGSKTKPTRKHAQSYGLCGPNSLIVLRSHCLESCAGTVWLLSFDRCWATNLNHKLAK